MNRKTFKKLWKESGIQETSDANAKKPNSIIDEGASPLLKEHLRKESSRSKPLTYWEKVKIVMVCEYRPKNLFHPIAYVLRTADEVAQALMVVVFTLLLPVIAPCWVIRQLILPFIHPLTADISDKEWIKARAYLRKI